MHSLLQKATPDSWSLGVLQCRSLFFSWRIITPRPDSAFSSYNAIWHPQPIIYTTPTNRQLTTPWGCYNAKLMKGKKTGWPPSQMRLGGGSTLGLMKRIQKYTTPLMGVLKYTTPSFWGFQTTDLLYWGWLTTFLPNHLMRLPFFKLTVNCLNGETLELVQ